MHRFLDYAQEIRIAALTDRRFFQVSDLIYIANFLKFPEKRKIPLPTAT